MKISISPRLILLLALFSMSINNSFSENKNITCGAHDNLGLINNINFSADNILTVGIDESRITSLNDIKSMTAVDPKNGTEINGVALGAGKYRFDGAYGTDWEIIIDIPQESILQKN